MMLFVVIPAVYLAGFFLCRWMLITDHKSEGNLLTFGDRATTFVISLLSWLAVLWVLVATWIGVMTKREYWNKAVDPRDDLVLKKIKEFEEKIEQLKPVKNK